MARSRRRSSTSTPRPFQPALRGAFVDADASGPGASGFGDPIVVPALLTRAYHGRVDLPAVLREAGVPARLTPVLGPSAPDEAPDPRLLSALVRRLSEVDIPFDGIALLAAGTSNPEARSTVESVAASLSDVFGCACRVGYASGGGSTSAEAVTAVAATGARRVIAGAYFLAPGRLYDAASASAAQAGVVGVAAPLGVAPELVELVVARADDRCAVVAA